MIITKYVQDWFTLAEDDLLTSRTLLDQKVSNNQACFHCQQVAKKYLKGFLAYREKHIRKIHDIEILLSYCKEIDSSFEELSHDAFYLTQLYLTSRYPDDYQEFSYEEAERAYQAALKVKDFVLERIKG